MALFRQLRLLLWKNGLVAIRQPVWSLTLIIWPLIIFIILAVTRNQFPPVQKDTCYVSPRNLPSAGFFPFLQTLMCNTDSSCNNESYLVDPAAQKTRSTQQRSSPLGSLVKGAPSFDSDFLKDINPGTLLAALKDIYGAPVQQRANNVSSMNEYNTLLGDQEFLNQSQGSVNVLKRAACTMILPMINTTSSSTLNYAVAAYCQSNNTVLEVSLRTLNQILTELMVTKPDEMLKKAGVMMEAFDQLQNHPALWESLLAAPRALSSGSPDQVLGSTNDLLTHLQGALHVTKGNFSDTDAALSSLHPVLVGGINMINYIQNWPGKNVSVSLGDIIALQNDSISEVVKHVLPEVQIPLHQAIVLAWDKDMARSYVCNNGSNSVFVTAACSTGTMDILLSWISPYKVATQALLAWSKDVAPQDVAFVKGLLHSMTEGSYPGGQGASTSRARRSIDTQPQNIEEELFLSIGQVVLEIIEDVPEVDMFVQSILRTSFQVMTLAAEDLEGAEEMMVSVLKVFELLQPINRTLANESDSNVWMDYVMDEVTEIIMKSLTSESLKCEDLLVDPFEWLLNNQSIIINMWMSMICQSNYSTLQQVLLMDWPTLMQKAQEIYSNLTDQATYNVTLHMVLSEWQELKSHSLRFQALLERLTTGLGQVYWMNWTPDSGIHNATGTLLESVFLFMVNFGEKLEESQLWPKVKDYFHTIFWILSYRPNVSIHPANCSFDNHTMALHCDTGLNWPQFVQAVAQALMSPSKALVNCLNGTLNLLEYVYGDIYKYVVASNLTQEIKGEDVLSAYLNNLTRNLDGFFQMASIHPDRNTSNPHVMLPLLGYLLQPTGLTPLLPLFFSDDPINASTVIDIASNLGRSNQHIFIFNDTDPSVPELEQLLMQFFSLDGNLTLSISHIIGYSLLSYYNYFNLEDVAHLRESIQPFKNQTSAGLVGILRAMELLKTVIDSQNGDPVNVTLLYIRQLQELVMSLCKFQKIKQHLLPSGQMSVAQVIGPQMLSKDFFNFLTPENLQNLTRAGPDAAQNILIQTFVAFLPAGIQQKAARFLQHFQALQYQISKCAEGQNCSDDISNIFTFLDQILDMMRSADGNASINITGINTVLGGWENEEITSTFFSLLLSPDDAAEVETFKKIFYFIRLITATQNISLSDIQTTLGKLNLTLDELNNIAALAGTDNINDLMDNIMEVINARQCFEPQNDSVMTTRCVMGFITRISRFLTHLPDFYNETDFIPIIFNETFSPTQFNLSSNPSMLLIHALNSTLINIKMRLHLNQSNTHEIMEEIEVLERLIKLAASMDPFTSNFNTTLMTDPKWAQNVYQEIVEWYLKRLENITSNSSIDFIRWIMAAGNISLSDIQTALEWSNLTLDELSKIAALAKGASIYDLMVNIKEIINARKCFEPQNDLMMTTQCVIGFINGISRFLTHLPDFSNETDFLSLIPLILNETFSDVVQVNVSSNPNMFIVHLLNSTLANIKMSLQLNQMNTSEIMNEIKVLEDLMQLLDNTDPFTNSLNTTLMENPIYAQKVSIEIVEWYLKRLENITSNTSVSELLRPYFYLTQMQLTFQLAQTDFSLYVSNQIQFLIDSIPHPIDGEGVIKIGYTVVEILQHLFNITKDNPVLEPLFKTIILNTSNHHTELYLDLIEKWMEQPNVTLILTNILQWGNSSMNVSNQMTDIQQLQQTVANFLSDDQLAYLAMIGNITRSLSKVLMVAEQPGGLQSDHFLAAILEVEKSAMQLLTNATGHMPLSVQQDILEIVQYSLKLLLQPDVSFASSHNISLLILKRAENIIQQTIPGMFADYLLYGLKVATTYFEGIATAGGPEHWNDLVLNEMKTVQSILPPNSTVQAYISLLINITHFILETGQGNRSLWEGFEGVSVQNATIITEQMGKLLSILWPLGMGGPNSNTTAQSLEGFSSFVPILEQIITCQADNDTWDKLEKVLEALLSTLEETELLDNASSGMPLFEKSIGRLVNIIQAQNVMMASLQKPLVILMREIVQSVNTSHYNFSQVLPGMQHAIDSTIQAAQCNGILKCSEALNIWDPVIEAAGLSYNTMAMWCNISLQPALEASVAAQTAFSNLSMSDMGEEPMTESATAARIVKTVQSLYQVWVNETLVTEQLIMAFSNEFSELFGHRLSPEVHLYWQRKLQEMHMQTSVSSMRMLSGELRSKIPSLQPYTDAGEKALDYILNNYNLIKNGSSSEDFFRKAAMIFLTSVNISPDIFSEMWGNWSGVSESSYIEMMRGIIKLMGDLHILRDAPTVYQAMEKFLESNDTSLIMQKVVEMSAWWNSTEASRLDLVTQALPKICDTIMPLLPLLNQMGMDIPANMKLCDDLAGNMAVMLRQLVNTSGLLPPMAYEPTGGNHMVWFQQRHKGPWMPMRSPMDDFIDLFYIDYSDMFKAISVPPTTEEIMETAHMFFDNPDLSVVLKGATGDMQWGFNDLQEDTIDAGLGMLAFLTLPITFQMSPMDILTNATDILPDDYSFSSLLKNITIAMATESQELLNLKQHIIQTANEIFQTNLTDPRFTEEFDHLRSQVCALENTKSAHLLMSLFSIEPGQLCNTFLPSLQFLIENRLMNMTSLADAIFDAFIGDPITYTVQATWSSVLAQSLKFNTSSLKDLNVNMTSPGTVMVGEMLRNQTAFVLDVQQYMDFNLSVLHLLMETPLPNSNKEILSWLANLHQCSSASMNMKGSDVVIFNTFCSMSTEQWYTFSLLVARHLNLEKFTFRLLLCEELQSMMGVMLQLVQVLTDAMDKLLPSIGQLQKFLLSIEDLSLGASNEFKHTRHRRSVTSSEATFVTLSRALCSNGIMALFAISEIPSRSDSSPSSPNNQEREEIIERFKIPRNATPYCTNMFLEMVSTTGGAIAWAFLKPMLMGQILYTPDTDVTRAIMEKSNDTLHEFANLAQNSGDWIKTSGQIVKSAELLSHTLPMLQNSLSNAFVKNFIELHTDINVDRMKETIGNFSDMTMMLNQNKRVLDQISTLSNVLVNISSCIKFDRYRGYDSADQLDAAAQELAKNRELYAGVIFKLPKEDSSWNLSSSTSPLPPIVSYTIRMHMDNVIRTDRTRDSYFMKHPHMLARKTMRYNRGFVYLQENLDRAIIEIQTRQKVTEPAVQLQAFPYPCHLRDEYLDGISFNFPTMMMMAWVLFVADFVKKKVHERELRLHEYMKMMGVNPLSHFFAWFLESAAYLLMTIIILTLVLKHGRILPNSDGFILFLYFCDYGFSILAFSYLVSSFFDQTYIAGLSGSLLYILCFFPFLVVMSVEGSLNIFQKSALSLFSPTCFSYAGQYVFRYENQGEGIQWSNSYTSPLAGDTASFGWMCWLMLIDSILYFLIGVYIRMVFPGKYGIPAPWYFPFKASFWADLCCSSKPRRQVGTGLLFTNIMQQNQHLFPDDKGKDECTLSCQSGENFSTLPVGVTLHGLTKIYGDRAAIQNLNVSFYEGHVTSLLGHNGAGKTTTMSLLTGLFAPSSGTIEVYGRDMQSNIDDVRKELGVCMQYDVLFDHMTAKEHLLLYGQIKAPHWSPGQLREQIRKTLEETGMYAHRHKLVGALSGGMKRKLSISIAFIGGSRLVVLDEPTTGVDPCSRRSIWDIIIQNKKQHTIIMSTHHLDEAEVLSDRIAFLEKGGLKCCGSPFYLKEKLGQGYKLTLNKKLQMTNQQSGNIDDAELKAFVQAHVPGAQLKEVHRGDLIYSLPPLTSSNTSSYRSLLAALDSNLDSLQLEGYGISDTTLEEVFLQLTHENTEAGADDGLLSVSETLSDTGSLDSFPSDDSEGISSASDMIKLTSSTVLCGMALTWQQISAILIKRFHHSRRDWKGLLSQILLPVLFVIFAMSLGSIKNNLKNYPEMELSPALYNIGPSYSFFRNQNPNSSHLVDAMMSFPGIDNACLNKPDKTLCRISANSWSSSGNSSKGFSVCKCTPQEQICEANNFQPPHTQFPSSQIVYDLSGIDTENYLVATANDFIRNRYGGFDFGMPLPSDLQKDLKAVPKNRTLSKVWFNPEGFHTMPAYLNSLNNFILRSNLPADKDPRDYAIFVSSHPYFGRMDDEDIILQGMLHILVALCVMLGYSIMTASFAIYEVNEHHGGSKALQHIAGISEPLYWTVNFFYDMVMYMIPVTLTVVVVAAFQIPAFTDRQNLAAVTLLMVLFGFATFPWMYLLSSVFKDAEMAFIIYVCINLFISINTITSTSILYFLSQISHTNLEAIKDTLNTLNCAFKIFPQFNFGNGLIELARKDIDVQILSGYGIDAYQNPFSTESLGWMFMSSFIQGLVFFTLRLLFNRSLIRKVRRLICGRKTVSQEPCEDEDEDVVAEHLRVSSGGASSDILQVNQLTKVYQYLKTKVHAVKRLSVGIPAGECFGLLGVNGAGKTTTFKMLTGDVSPTDGTAQIRDWDGRLVDIMECRNKGINIGYCPQVDALDSLLTGREHLYFYARIRGISKREIDRLVNYLLKRLELSDYSNIITDGYSCGTRRKLSTALALIGHPQILLLDEPSSGMDPRTKRHLWKIISEEVKGKSAVVLTSHSMEECEALCSRLAIMVKGQFRCLGSLQHIKNRFGNGFTVKMYMANASCDAQAITNFMQHHFPSTYLKDQHSTMVDYHVPIAPGGVADIFDKLESNRNTLQIKHFSVSQTTLDEVFINFAMGKVGMETIPQGEDEHELGSIKAIQTKS